MTREDIIRMAREAGVLSGYESELFQRFAALVAAYTLSNIDPSKFMSFQEGMEAGCFAEREACAKVCETRLSNLEHADKPYNNGVRACAAAIRARGK